MDPGLRSTGHQTVFPGSTHESGEPIEWTAGTSETPTAIDAATLARGVQKVAAASLLARHWAEGARQDASLAIAGALLRDGWPAGDVKTFIDAVAVAAKSPSVIVDHAAG